MLPNHLNNDFLKKIMLKNPTQLLEPVSPPPRSVLTSKALRGTPNKWVVDNHHLVGKKLQMP